MIMQFRFLQDIEQSAIYSDNIHVFGKGEGAVAEEIAAYIDGQNPTVATYAKDGEMFVRVTAKAGTKEEAALLCEPVTKEIVAILGDVVYGVNVDSLEQTVVNRLFKQRRNSCYSGILHRRFGFKKINRYCRGFGSI